jgi:hypothetical protein
MPWAKEEPTELPDDDGRQHVLQVRALAPSRHRAATASLARPRASSRTGHRQRRRHDRRAAGRAGRGRVRAGSPAVERQDREPRRGRAPGPRARRSRAPRPRQRRRDRRDGRSGVRPASAALRCTCQHQRCRVACGGRSGFGEPMHARSTVVALVEQRRTMRQVQPIAPSAIIPSPAS